jgi:hypothetical protein
MNSSMVSAEIDLRLVVPEDESVPLLGSLYYSKDDPYAIRVAFHTGIDDPVEWAFGRELLSMGLAADSGLGDVRIWPALNSGSGLPDAVLNIEVSSHHGHAHFEAPFAEVSDFLRRTYEVVPAGQESSHFDIDAELSALLRRALD